MQRQSRQGLSLLLNINKLTVRHVQKDMDKYNCKYAGILIMSHMHFMETKDPCLFCLNDFSGISKEKENIHRDYLRKRFTKKSSFEK